MLLPVLLFLCCVQARAESIEALGQTIRFSNPGGYCTVDNSERELDLLSRSRRALPPSIRLLHVAVRCSELEALKNGQRDYLDHWLQIQLIGPRGDFKRLEISRETFLAGVSKASPNVDTAEMNKRLKTALENPDLNLKDAQVAPIGRDGNAAYFSTRMTLADGQTSRQITGLGCMTLVNSLPLNVIVYEGTGHAKSRDQLHVALRQLLLSVVSGN